MSGLNLKDWLFFNHRQKKGLPSIHRDAPKGDGIGTELMNGTPAGTRGPKLFRFRPNPDISRPKASGKKATISLFRRRMIGRENI
jgi:hypothetical protein